MNDEAHTVRRALILGAALILVTNAVALLGVAYNRAGEPDSALDLSERELVLPYDWGRNRDDTGLALRLAWRVLPPDSAYRGDDAFLLDGRGWIQFSPDQTPAWLDSAKLSAMDFDLTRPLDTPRAREYYRRLLPKRVYLVLEMDGPTADTARERARAWVTRQEQILRLSADSADFARRMQEVHSRLRTELVDGSRLFAVDAGLDRPALRARYPDRTRYAIIHAVAGMRLVGPDTAAELGGYIHGPANAEINISRAFRPVFDVPQRRIPGASGPGQPYAVTVAFGRRLEPWITAAARR